MAGGVLAMGEKGTRLGEGSEIGQPAPNFLLKDLAGKKVKLSDYRGKIVFLNFWATWCPPCRAEMPSIQTLFKQQKKLKILAVSLDQGATAAVKSFVVENHYTFTVLHDLDGKVASRYHIMGIPTTFILNKRGIIVDKMVGSREWSDPVFLKELGKLF